MVVIAVEEGRLMFTTDSLIKTLRQLLSAKPLNDEEEMEQQKIDKIISEAE